MLSHHIQDRGTLSYVDFGDLIFEPKRMYFIHGVPKDEVRGGHGHRNDQQYITCVEGKIKIKLVSKEGTEEKMIQVLTAVLTLLNGKISYYEKKYKPQFEQVMLVDKFQIILFLVIIFVIIAFIDWKT